MNQTEQATIDLVINGRQAETSLGSMGRAVISLTRELRNMVEADDPARYAALIARRNQLNDTYQEMNERVMRARRSMQSLEAEVDAADNRMAKFWDRVKSFALGDVIGGAISSIGSAIKGVWDGSEAAFKESDLTQTALANKLKQTGSAVGETKEQLVQLQTELMNLTGVDDDVIAKGEDMMLSFTNVRGVIFDQAIPAVTNWVSAMNGGKVTMEAMQSGAEILGKGLDDLTKIKKTAKAMDVTLTEAEYNEIQARRKHNDVMGAQQIFIDALNKRYGGLAETLSTTESGAAQRFETRIGNIQEVIGKWITQGKNLMATVLSPFLDFVEKVTSSKLSETMEQERLEMNMLVLQITDANTKQTERVGLIKKLKEQYPGYLQNLDAEKSSNLEIAKAGERVNEMYINRIILAKKDEQIEEQNKVAAELRMKQLDAETNMREALVKLHQKMPQLTMPATGTTFEKLNAMLAQYQKMQENARMATGGIFDPTFRAGRALQEYQSYLKQAQEATNGANQMLIKRNELMKELGITPQDEKFTGVGTGGTPPPVTPPTGGLTDAERKGEETAAAAKKKAQEEALAMSADFTQKIIEFNAAILADTLDKNDKEIQSTENKFDKMISDSQAALIKYKSTKYASDDEVKKHESEIQQLQVAKVEAVNAIRLRQEQDLFDSIETMREQSGVNLKTELDKEMATINQKFDQLSKDAGDNESAQYLIYFERYAALSDAKAKEEQRLQDELKRIKGEGLMSDEDKQAAELAKIEQHANEELKALTDKFSLELQATQEFKDAQDAILDNKKAAIKNVNENGPDAKKQKEAQKERKQAALDGAQTIADAVFSINRQREQAETDAKLADLEKAKERELDNANLTADQRAAINDKYHKQEAAIKLKQWESDRDAAATQAIINGALAFVKALPNWYLAAAAGAAAVAQVVVIESQTPPTFAGGGSTAMAYSDNPAGYVSTPTLFKGKYIAGEMGAEWIAPNWMLQNPYTANVMGALEALRQQGPGAVSSTQGGGGNTVQQSSSAADPNYAVMVSHLADIKTAIQNQEVYINYQNFKKQMDRIAQLETNTNAKST